MGIRININHYADVYFKLRKGDFLVIIYERLVYGDKKQKVELNHWDKATMSWRELSGQPDTTQREQFQFVKMDGQEILTSFHQNSYWY